MSAAPNIDPPVSAAERAHRSVFVGNIPYEATEEQLREIFLQAGTIVSFRLVYDRETGKPKGYGFCEYQDQETAQSAMRNLNNHDFNGRPLRVGVAAGDQNKDEMKGMQQAVGGPTVESPFGEAVEPEKAPEAISKAVASLPPEQMFELMKQMKLCIQNNPNEARNMLLQNPQLAYALLQAQIVMKIVDPQVAMAMLHRDRSQIPPVLPSEDTTGNNPSGNLPMQVVAQMQGGVQAVPQMPGGPQNQGGPPPMPEGMHMQGGPPRGMMGPGQQEGPMQQGRPGPPQMPHNMGPRGPMPTLLPGLGGLGPQRPLMGMPGGVPRPVFPPDAGIRGPQPEMDRMRGPPEMDRMRQQEMDRMRQQEMEHMRGQEMERMRAQQEMDRIRGQPEMDRMRGPPEREPMRGPSEREHMRGQPEMERMRGQPEIRERDMGGVPPQQTTRSQPIAGLSAPAAASSSPAAAAAGNISSQDQEKAALIMQVLQLTDQQIAMLPPEQRQSILILKDQIANQRQ